MTQLSFSQVASLWKADKRQYVKSSSYAAYVFHLNAHLLPYFGTRLGISQDDVQEYANQMLRKGLALKTVKDTVLILKMVRSRPILAEPPAESPSTMKISHLLGSFS